MLVEKEVIAPGIHWYRDEATGLPRKLTVTPTETKYWHEQGNKMLSGTHPLTVPVPCEHDFAAHPMTPADKLKNNAGWVKEYRLKGANKDKLFAVIDVVDEEIAKKLPRTIRWTSPWISSFTDGKGRDWKNVISHLALTTRPRIIEQAPFSGISAALSLATDVPISKDTVTAGDKGICLSKAGKLAVRKRDKKLVPRYPVAFSLFAGGIKLAEEDMPPPKKKEKKPGEVGKLEKEDSPAEEEEYEGEEKEETPGSGGDGTTNGEDGSEVEPFKDPAGDVSMEELLADLLSALDIHVQKTGNEKEFKRCLYNAAMTKIHELTEKGRSAGDGHEDDLSNPGGTGHDEGPDPMIQQEQQPMYMSLEEINKLPDPVKGLALSMYNENAKSAAKTAELEKKLSSLSDAKLNEEKAKRATRVLVLGKLSPRVKADLDAMLALPAMALSMGDGGVVIDPMAQTLAVLEKGLQDMPKLLTTDKVSLAMQPQPTDEDMLTAAQEDELAERMARRMGAPPEQKKAS